MLDVAPQDTMFQGPGRYVGLSASEEAAVAKLKAQPSLDDELAATGMDDPSGRTDIMPALIDSPDKLPGKSMSIDDLVVVRPSGDIRENTAVAPSRQRTLLVFLAGVAATATIIAIALIIMLLRGD